MKVEVEISVGRIVEVDTPQGIEVIQVSNTVAQVVEAGPQGPRGAPGVSGASYVHDQGVPDTNWAIQHNLGRFPSVTVVDSTGSEVEGDTNFIDANAIQITFSAAFAGKAYIN